MKRARLPRGWRLGHDDSIACPHRDVSVCRECASAHDEVVEVLGAHFWVDDQAARVTLRGKVAATRRDLGAPIP